jgi:predicted enzyme related to lactoylglutathione lyase
MESKYSKRLIEFYSKVFGWDMTSMGESMANYILAGTTETENMQSTKPGEINGGFFESSEENNKYPLVTIKVEDMKEAMEAVKAAGGKVLSGPHDIPGVGQYTSFQDSEDNRVSLLQPLSR